MSELLVQIGTAASLLLSGASLFFTVLGYRRLDDQASEAFAVIGADEGNHEARLERLETVAGLEIIPSPSAIDALSDEGRAETFAADPETTSFAEEFLSEHENTELQAQDHDEAANDDEFDPPMTATEVVKSLGVSNGN